MRTHCPARKTWNWNPWAMALHHLPRHPGCCSFGEVLLPSATSRCDWPRANIGIENLIHFDSMEFAENICSAYSASAHFRICSVSEALQHDQPFGRRRFLESQMPRNGLNGLCSEMTLLYCSRLKSSAKMKNGM